MDLSTLSPQSPTRKSVYRPCYPAVKRRGTYLPQSRPRPPPLQFKQRQSRCPSANAAALVTVSRTQYAEFASPYGLAPFPREEPLLRPRTQPSCATLTTALVAQK